jgi:hypothetical protein
MRHFTIPRDLVLALIQRILKHRYHTSVLTLVQPSATVQPWAEQSASPRTSRKIFSLTP